MMKGKDFNACPNGLRPTGIAMYSSSLRVCDNFLDPQGSFFFLKKKKKEEKMSH